MGGLIQGFHKVNMLEEEPDEEGAEERIYFIACSRLGLKTAWSGLGR